MQFMMCKLYLNKKIFGHRRKINHNVEVTFKGTGLHEFPHGR